MGPAIIGLVGVVIGAVITSGFQWIASARADTSRERVAARVMHDEIWWWYVAAKQAVYDADLSKLPERGELFNAWKQYRSDLARLTSSDWFAIQSTLRLAETCDDPGMRTEELTNERARILDLQLAEAEEATQVLVLASAGGSRERRRLINEFKGGHWQRWTPADRPSSDDDEPTSPE